MSTFQTKFRLIEAEQFFPDKPLPFHRQGPYVAFTPERDFHVTTAHGDTITLQPGMWVVKEPSGPHTISFAAYPVRDDIFAMNYELQAASAPLLGRTPEQQQRPAWQPIETAPKDGRTAVPPRRKPKESIYRALCADLVEDARVDGTIISLLVPRVVLALRKHGLLPIAAPPLGGAPQATVEDVQAELYAVAEAAEEWRWKALVAIESHCPDPDVHVGWMYCRNCNYRVHDPAIVDGCPSCRRSLGWEHKPVSDPGLPAASRPVRTPDQPAQERSDVICEGCNKDLTEAKRHVTLDDVYLCEECWDEFVREDRSQYGNARDRDRAAKEGRYAANCINDHLASMAATYARRAAHYANRFLGPYVDPLP